MLSGGKDTMVFVNNFYFNKVSEIYYVALDLELRRSPGERNGYPLQYSGLENSMDSIVHGVTKSQTWLSDFHFHFFPNQFSSVQFSCSVMPESLQLHGLQQPRLLCPPPTPRVYSHSRPLSQWYHPTISSSHLLLLLPSVFPSKRVFSSESVLRIRWPKYWIYSFSPSNGYSGLISFRMGSLDLLKSIKINAIL